MWVGGGLFGAVLVGIIIYLYSGGGSSSFNAEAHGDLTDEDEYGEFELTGEVDGDDSPDGNAGLFDDNELE